MKKNLLNVITNLIAQRHRAKGLLITLGLAFGSLLDIASLASFFPILILIVNQDQSEAHWLISNIYQVIKFESPVTLGIALVLVVVFLSIFKTVYQIWITHLKARFAYEVSNELADQTLASYLHSSYWNFTVTDYSKEINKISNFPLNFANNIIIPAGTLFSELLLLAFLILTAAIYDFQILFWLVAIVAPSILLYRLNRNRIKKLNDQIKETYPSLLKFTMESVEGWSEIKSFGKEGFFKAKFSNQFQKLGAIFSRDHTLHTNTSRVTELVALAGIAVLLVYTLINSKTPGDSIIALGIYFGIGFRAIPSVNRIFASWLRIKSNEYILSELIALGRSNQFAEVASTSSINFKEKIALSNISFTQPDGIEIFKGLSLTVLKGQRILIKGPSGSGKTTLLLLLMRFIKQQSGDLTVDDIAITSKLENAWLRKIAYVPQAPYILDATIKENIAFGVPKNEINNEKVSEFVSVLGLKNWVDELENGINTVIGERGVKISGGQRQRLAIGRALYHDAEVLLLDEITNQLDPATELEIIKALDHLQRRGKTIIAISHHQSHNGGYDVIYQLNAGVLTESKILNTAEN